MASTVRAIPLARSHFGVTPKASIIRRESPTSDGRVVVLEFWASWCVACRALAPTLNDWHEEFSPLGIHILGISSDPFEEAVRASEDLAFPTYSDEEGEVTLRYQGTALPTLVLVDGRGIVVDVMVGLDLERLPKFKAHALSLAGAGG